jgi:hypothetical protein
MRTDRNYIAPVRRAPRVVRGLFSAAPSWTEVLLADMVTLWLCLIGK